MSRRGEKDRDCYKQKKFNLCSLTDEEIADLMNSIETDDEFEEDSDNSIEDPDYRCDDNLKPEENAMIDDCLQLIDSSSLVNAIDLSMNVGDFSSNITDVSQQVSVTVTNEKENAVPQDNIITELPESISAKPQIEATTSLKPKKRARSPLPSVEASGPQIIPTAGGFTGGGQYFNINFYQN